MRCEIHDLEFIDVRHEHSKRSSTHRGTPYYKPAMACPACVAAIREKVRLERVRHSYWRPGRRIRPSLWTGLREFTQ